ncbi:DNA repair protein RecO [Chlamydia buteonis]|uniref:DNA repair protein RecO n=1 Tax=Chlamydia buteonis TaxID=2494525 RepID=A0ABX8LDJ6_9CHLA|nr:DNA repair protein RecO [Chlamydia buteonis]QXE27412.1 DNA repair protein RecO [Chlamydia buteonis]QXE27695.1 DNA repair protein RecO [Chlamydia buteonis]
MHTLTPAITLKNLPQGKHHCITTIFSPLGLLTFFAKQGQSLYYDFRDALIPLSLGIYSLDHSPPKMRKLLFAEVKNTFSAIKSELPLLQAAGKMTQSILGSQWQEKPSQELFSLFLNFLHRLPESKNPEMFAATFLLKLLQYEGILDLSTTCASCKKTILSSSFYRHKGRKFCIEHRPKSAVIIENEEEQILHALVHAKRFQDLLNLSNFHLEFSEKITLMFDSVFHEDKHKKLPQSNGST